MSMSANNDNSSLHKNNWQDLGHKHLADVLEGETVRSMIIRIGFCLYLVRPFSPTSIHFLIQIEGKMLKRMCQL